MTDLELHKIEEITREYYKKAKKAVDLLEHRSANFDSKPLSDVIPSYKASQLEFGAFNKDSFAVLFIDIRKSTDRAETIGPINTFLSMHAFIPTMLQVIEYYKGYVIDIMGDGIMAFFGKHNGLTKECAIQNAGLCGRDMLRAVGIVNSILFEDGIDYKIICGVGVDYGQTIITKIGIDSVFDVKAFGDCINKASKYSKEYNKVKVSKKVKEHWPKGPGGTIKFVSSGDGYILS